MARKSFVYVKVTGSTPVGDVSAKPFVYKSLREPPKYPADSLFPARRIAGAEAEQTQARGSITKRRIFVIFGLRGLLPIPVGHFYAPMPNKPKPAGVYQLEKTDSIWPVSLNPFLAGRIFAPMPNKPGPAGV